MTKDTVKTKFADVMYNSFKIGDQELIPGKSFKDGLAMDSLDRIELVVEAEREFRIVLSDAEIESAKTVGEMITIIYHKVKED